MECYWAYADYNDMMALTEELFETACKAVHGTTTVTRSIAQADGTAKEITLDFKAPWPRLRLKDAIRQFANIDVDELNDEQLHTLIENHRLKATTTSSRGEITIALFEELCEHHIIQPTHVIDHPIESSPLCKTLRSGDKTIIEQFESYCMGKELCNAYSELNDPVLQRTLLEGQSAQLRAGADEAHPMDEDFVQAIEYGMPPAGGLGVGIDRMVIFLLGVEGIRDIIFFPTMRPEQ
jgi:lysyl-tRNA synthetase class 2